MQILYWFFVTATAVVIVTMPLSLIFDFIMEDNK